MKILFCSHNPVRADLGAPKVLIELAAELQKIGWQCSIASDQDIAPGIDRLSGVRRLHHFSAALRRYLHANAAAFDVVDYDHVYLPYPREEFSLSTLMVARSVLLIHHFDKIKLPRFRTLHSCVGAAIYGPHRWATRRYGVWLADRTLREADLINVCNQADRTELEQRGFLPEDIVVIPFGLTQERWAEFAGNRAELLPPEPRVAFVGTLDLRKGAREMPDIMARIVREIPGVKFRLLGTRNLSRAGVMRLFPQALHAHLEIFLEFKPTELPELLAGCSLGIFPSRIEGFPFGVLEMLAAALPVVAYNVPGPPMMLMPDHLIPAGDSVAVARVVADLLSDPARLLVARRRAKHRGAEFKWQSAAQMTSETYQALVDRRRSEQERPG